MLKSALYARRFLLKHLVPESVWPESCEVESARIQIRNAPYSFGVKRLLSRDPQGYELAERALCKRSIRPGDQVLEFGGSIGIVTAVLQQLVGDSGRVVSVEASPSITEYSSQWLGSSPNVEILTGFAFPLMERIPLSFDFDESGGSLGGTVVFGEGVADSPSDNECDNRIFISDVMREHNLRPDALVLDIEGSEETMLLAKPNLPDCIRTAVVEFHPEIYGVEKQLQIIDTIRREGFELTAALDNVGLFERSPA
ncbi:MAG: hypothetical protein AAGA92_00535 [Planctomycetota bacterium]